MPRRNRNPGDYEVGFGKPPKESQFKKGQSGNPTGKRKPPLPLDELFRKLLASKIRTTSGRLTSVRDGIATATVLAMLDANKPIREIRERLELLQRLDDAGTFDVTPDDIELLEQARAAFEYRASRKSE